MIKHTLKILQIFKVCLTNLERYALGVTLDLQSLTVTLLQHAISEKLRY